MNELIKPRTIITFIFVLTFCGLSIIGKINPDAIIAVLNVLLGYWFGERIGRKNGQTNPNKTTPPVL